VSMTLVRFKPIKSMVSAMYWLDLSRHLVFSTQVQKSAGQLGSGMGLRAEAEGFAVQFRKSLIAFAEFHELVFADIGERLARIAGRPPDFHRYDARGFTEADVLLIRRSSK